MRAVDAALPGKRRGQLRRTGSWACWSVAAALWIPGAGLTALRLTAGDAGTPWVQLLSLFPASVFPSMAAMAAALAAVCLEPRAARTVLAALATGVLFCQLLLVAPRVVPVSGTARAALDAPVAAFGAGTQGSVQPVTVMALNVGSTGVDAAGLLGQVRAWNVDILALPELAPAGVETLDAAGVGAVLPYRVLDVDGAGTGNAIFSRYPLQPMARIPGTSFYQTRAVVALPGANGGIQLTSVHIDSPRPGHTLAWRTELDQLSGLHRALPTDMHSVLLGDFNSGQDHAGFRNLLAAGLVDAAQTVGMGLAPTWPANAPVPAFTAIDHILVSPGVTVLGFSTVGFPGTDHAAVVATLGPRT